MNKTNISLLKILIAEEFARTNIEGEFTSDPQNEDEVIVFTSDPEGAQRVWEKMDFSGVTLNIERIYGQAIELSNKFTSVGGLETKDLLYFKQAVEEILGECHAVGYTAAMPPKVKINTKKTEEVKSILNGKGIHPEAYTIEEYKSPFPSAA